jgi:hypothetical protein
MKVSDYKIVTASNPKKVANAVMEYLRDGWELFGTPFPAPSRRKAKWPFAKQ